MDAQLFVQMLTDEKRFDLIRAGVCLLSACGSAVRPSEAIVHALLQRWFFACFSEFEIFSLTAYSYLISWPYLLQMSVTICALSGTNFIILLHRSIEKKQVSDHKFREKICR